jgi:hypothetical protein
MSLPKKFDERLRNAGLRAVWLPGSSIELGDVLQREDGIFNPIENISNMGVTYKKEKIPKDRTLCFQAQGVSSTVMQGGVEVDIMGMDVGANATVNIEFANKDGYFIRTPQLTGVGIDNLLKVGKQIASMSEWNHGKYYLAWRVLSAKDFVFIGSEQKNRKIGFLGAGRAVLKFLTLGLTAGINEASSSAGLIRVFGTGGPVAIKVVRIKKSGEIDFH